MQMPQATLVQMRHVHRCNGRCRRVELVREYLTTHLGATAKEVARHFGFGYSTACAYVETLRSEWRGKEEK